ncbi:MAG: hypothetical protein HY567_02930 [Candidatus Kerfeldbacteria bacterium]|nr:hypothetical protein [Candidatus Kerfeldbacteria bacterium]
MPVPSTKTELELIAYLRSRRIPFKYEPFGDRGKKPDFLITRNHKKILVEVKEIEETPFNKAIAATRHLPGVRTFSLDPRQLYNLLRERIKQAARQLKPYTDRVDHSIVILGFRNQFRDPTLDDLFYAMFGDPVIRFQVSKLSGAAITDPELELRYNGQLRKFDPKSGLAVAQHGKYLSGVGLVSAVKGLAVYQRRYYSRLKRKLKDAKAFFDYHQEKWNANQKNIPKAYRNPNRMFGRVEFISNVLGERPLPTGIFNGRFDVFRSPEVIEK